ncbi:MAG: FAD-dependent oxidoreductase [Candidatus Handelsmanbacteria bacterium]|nr:FAD-dependent oxidoreductase [Candidatus Handelsmanbacteria bacterium]
MLAGGLPWLQRCAQNPSRPVPGQIVNPAIPGHLLRQPRPAESFPPPSGPRLDAVVIGGGISGLCAAWRLRRAGIDRLLLLELGEELGGTSLTGRIQGRPVAWGAHYINIPPAGAEGIHALLQDLGIISGYDAAGRPQVDPGHLLRWPHERLFVGGRWVEELDPFAGAGEAAAEPLRRFEDQMLRWTLYRGREGRPAFALPLRYSSADTITRQLDRITMLEYLRSLGLDDPRLDWLVDYACRDDYGTPLDQVSAWAGIHYFSCRSYDRRLREEYPADTLTWPEGNGFLVGRLAGRLERGQWRARTAVLRVEPGEEEVRVGCLDTQSGEVFSLRARSAVYAGKLHTAPLVVQGLPARQREAIAALSYCAWLVGAIQVRRLPLSLGAPLAWDNILYDSPSLGYVDADHQGSPPAGPRVLLYHLPLVRDLALARRQLLEQDHAFWAGQILADLRRAHPDIDEVVERLDLYRWGHAMVQPRPGVIWGEEGRWRERPCGALAFAGCDTTGLPLFEEACFAGIRAAEGCLGGLGAERETLLPGLGKDG